MSAPTSSVRSTKDQPESPPNPPRLKSSLKHSGRVERTSGKPTGLDALASLIGEVHQQESVSELPLDDLNNAIRQHNSTLQLIRSQRIDALDSIPLKMGIVKELNTLEHNVQCILGEVHSELAHRHLGSRLALRNSDIQRSQRPHPYLDSQQLKAQRDEIKRERRVCQQEMQRQEETRDHTTKLDEEIREHVAILEKEAREARSQGARTQSIRFQTHSQALVDGLRAQRDQDLQALAIANLDMYQSNVAAFMRFFQNTSKPAVALLDKEPDQVEAEEGLAPKESE